MRTFGISTLNVPYHKLKLQHVFFILLAVALFIRFPFIFRDYVDRDESTFILVGQSWANGFLPYTQLWDLKPPITFLFFASIITVFGKSLIAIRLAGIVIVTVTAFYTYQLTALLSTKKVAFWAGCWSIFLTSMFGSLQGVMSEHISMVFFIPSLYFMASKKKSLGFFVAGILIGSAVLTKLNLAYPALALGLYILFYFGILKKQWKQALLNAFSFGLGALLVGGATLLQYYLHFIENTWWESVFIAPLKYASARRYAAIKLLPYLIVFSALLLFFWKKKVVDFKSKGVQISAIACFFVLVSFIKGGRINGHYLIQFHPAFMVLAAVAISKISWLAHKRLTPVYGALLFLLPAEAYLEYGTIAKSKANTGTFFNGEGIAVPTYLKAQGLATDNIFFLEYHIGYWLLNALPPSVAATHPSNISRPELFPFFNNPRTSSLEELRFIFEEKQPAIVVRRKDRLPYANDNEILDAFTENYLKTHYTLIHTIQDAEILQRK